MPAVAPLEWNSRRTRCDSSCSVRFIRKTRCGRYGVIEAISQFELPTAYYAVTLDTNGGNDVISRHRVEERAKRACHLHNRGSH